MIKSEKQPIFIQLKNYYASLITAGSLQEGDALPSVREEAAVRGINMMTVQRAYKSLEEEGYVTSMPKKGYFVAKRKQEGSSYLVESLLRILEEGYSKEDIKNALEGIVHD